MNFNMKRFIARLLSFFFRLVYKVRYGSKVIFGKRVIVNHRFKFSGKGRAYIGDDVNLWAFEEKNRFATFSQNAVIRIGAGTRLNGVLIQAGEKIVIGENCTIGSAIIMDNDFHSINYINRNNKDFIHKKPVIIGDRVWLGGQCVILKGVKLGNEAVVGFRSVVTKNVPEKVVVAGNPAKIVKKI